LCRIGFGRVVFSRIQGNMSVARSAHIAGDADLTAAPPRVGRAHPQRVWQCLPEGAGARDKGPIPVTDPQSDPRVDGKPVGIVTPNCRITAPVYVWQTPVALLHADVPTESGSEVGAEQRDLLGLLTEGLGAIMERNIVAERMQSVRSAAEQHLQRTHSLTVLFEEDLDSTKCSEYAQTADNETITSDIAEHLTRRERQVLNLMAAGKTNAQIAARLFISDNTVKSHVRHIMQKLGTSNRTAVVARYQSSRRYPPSAQKR
jgi:DNA-binding CsgD family transcriptional regulator